MSALVTDLKNLCEEDGDRTVVAGLAFPGLQDMNHDMLELLSYVEITADVQGFALETTVTVATNGLFDDIVGETDGSFDGLDDFRGDLDKLTDAMNQLLDGSSRLYDGLSTLLDSSNELVSGIDQLAAGAKSLKDGAGILSAGAGKLQSGAAQLQSSAAALSQGLGTLAGNNEQVNAGAAQVFQTLLSTADAQLATAGVQASALALENYEQVLGAIITCCTGHPRGRADRSAEGILGQL